MSTHKGRIDLRGVENRTGADYRKETLNVRRSSGRLENNYDR